MVRKSTEDVARGIVERLRGAGHVALFAGGCVRDRLLGLDRPRSDYDVATSARPDEVQRLFPRSVAVGEQFGVILVIEDAVHVEVATFRADDAYVDGRHPTSVRFTTPEEDAARRDFTINGMFFDPVDGKLYDYVSGRDDLERRVVRAIGDPRRRFAEDKLRLVRAVRFTARLGFRLDDDTAAAIREMAPEIHQVSRERIGEEVAKILLEGAARRGFELLSELRLLREILPEIEAMRGVEQGKEYHPEGDVFVHTLCALDHFDRSAARAALVDADDAGLRVRAEALALAVLLHDTAKPLCRQQNGGKITFYGHCEQGAEMTLGICRRLRRSNVVAERAAGFVRDHLRLLDAPQMRLATLKKFLRQDGIEDLLELCRIDASAASGNLEHYEFCRERLAVLEKEGMKPPALLSGRDLIALGYAPGPRFKEILGAVEEAQLEGTIATPEEALDLVRRRFPVDR